MSWSSRLRAGAMNRLPKRWQPVASYHYYRMRSLLEPELDILCRTLTRGVRAIDVGANEGVYTHAFARCGAVVEAFEPLPSCLDVLRSYERDHRNVRVHGHALGAQEGSATLYLPERDGRSVSGHASLEQANGTSATITVHVRPLDAYAFDNVGVIKVDVEGHELDVLRGGRNTMARNRPVLLVEIEQRHLRVPIATAFQEILALGYAGSFLHRERGMRPLGEFSPEQHQKLANADTPHALYINNFFFTPVERPATLVA